MQRKLFLAFILISGILLGLAPVPAGAAPDQVQTVLISDAVPTGRTPVELKEHDTVLKWYEDYLELQSSYRLLNPTAKKTRLTMAMPYRQDSSVPAEYTPVIKWGERAIKSQYNAKAGSVSWNLNLNAGEEQVLTVTYKIPATMDKDGLNLAWYTPSESPSWAGRPAETTLSIELQEIHLGQLVDIQPLTYQFKGKSLTWSFPAGQARPVLVKADVLTEKKGWESLLPNNDRDKLKELVDKKDYLEAAELFRIKALAADRETRLRLRVAQGYFLEKAGFYDDALSLWQDLYDDKSRSARVYWVLGQRPQNNKLELYQRVKEMQINPLLQSWLAGQLPPNRFKPAAPEKPEVTVDIADDLEGLLLNIKALDKDGDLEQVIVRYHWEDQHNQEEVFELKPFSYEHDLSFFIPAPGSLKRLFYEVVAVDKTENRVSTSQKEEFYLNNELKSHTYPLQGAVLVLADYDEAEQDKVYKWFLSYLKMAREAKFVPIVESHPYFIFLGQDHEFIKEYQGRLFIMHTPSPFNSNATRLHVHRYFLSYWYGSGWTLLPDKELGQLGDALMLGKGRYVMVFRYLAGEDPAKFAQMLDSIGQGKGWQQALSETYQMSFWQAQLGAVWFAYGNMVIAVFIILAFAWLGKTGHITRLILYFRERREQENR